MSTDYDAVAKEYKRSKLAPWRTYIERYSLLKLLGKVRGKSVLDLACGEGFYSRLVRERVAARVVGVDLSSGMIGLGIAAEKESPLGSEYRVGDAKAYQTDERFDIVAAAYLLNYADTEEKLAAMCQTVARSLKPGGRFVTVNNNPSQSPDRYQATRKYGVVKSERWRTRACGPSSGLSRSCPRNGTARWTIGTTFSTIRQSFLCSAGSRSDSCFPTGL